MAILIVAVFVIAIVSNVYWFKTCCRINEDWYHMTQEMNDEWNEFFKKKSYDVSLLRGEVDELKRIVMGKEWKT